MLLTPADQVCQARRWWMWRNRFGFNPAYKNEAVRPIIDHCFVLGGLHRFP